MILLSEISHRFTMGEESVKAIVNVDLEISPGEVIAITGPSGSGKSTLLNVIGCLLTPDSGIVSFLGEDVFLLNDSARSKLRREHIGFIFQSFNLIPVLSAYENVEYPLILNKVKKQERKDRINSLLDCVGMSKYQKHKPDQLSGGQRQRIAIARALVANPLVILADEPTANLDTHTAHGVLMLLSDINKQFNTSIVFSTHDAKVSAMAQRQIRLEDGRIIS